MKGLDNGPDGLDDAAFDRALGIPRPKMTMHGIALARAQALVDGDALTTALCDIAICRTPHADDLARLDAKTVSRLGGIGKREARAELAVRT
jgi:hypothetical protein